jgi:hypothetical protein
MDHLWAAQQLRGFQKKIDDIYHISAYGQLDFLDDQQVRVYDDLIEEYGSYENSYDLLISLDPVMRTLINAAQAGLGNYLEPPEEGWSYSVNYWRMIVKPCVLRAK